MTTLTSDYGDVTGFDQSIYDAVVRKLPLYADRPAIVNSFTDEVHTFSHLHQLILRVASSLESIGFRRHDVCCVYLPNTIQQIVSCLSVISLGGAAVPVNHASTVRELKYYIETSGATYIVIRSEKLSTARQLAMIKKVIVVGDCPDDRISFSSLLNGQQQQQQQQQHEYNSVKFSATPDDVAYTLFSSGTTGLPKAVQHINSHFVTQCLMLQHSSFKMAQEGRDVTLCSLPLFHLYGIIYLYNNLSNGLTMVLQERFNADNYVKCIEKYQVSSCWLVPPILTAITQQQQQQLQRRDVSSLKVIVSSAAPLTKTVAHDAEVAFPSAKIFQLFGMTELFVALLHPANEKQHKIDPSSVGKLLPGCKAKVIRPADGSLAGPREIGELAVKSPCCFSGYYRNDTATRQSFTKDKFFLTGDLGYYDENGVFYLTGRRKELIKYKGFQISPTELEDVLREHIAVKDAVVLPVEDELAGQLPMAFVVLNDGQTTTKADLMKYMSEQVAPYKQLRGGIEFIGNIPTSASGKIQRRTLQEELTRRRRTSSRL